MEERDLHLLDHSYSKRWEEGGEDMDATPTPQPPSNAITKLDATQDNFENILFSLLKMYSVHEVGHKGRGMEIAPQALDTLSSEQVDSLVTSNSINYLAIQQLIAQRNRSQQQNGPVSPLNPPDLPHSPIPTTTPTMATPTQSAVSIQISPTQLKQLQLHVSELLRQHNVHITEHMTPEQQQLIINSLITQQAIMTPPPVAPPLQALASPPAQATDKRKKDDKRPPTPFNIFFHEIYPTVQQEHPNLTFSEASKIVSSTWNMLGQEGKQKYYEKHGQLKKEFASKQQNKQETVPNIVKLYSDSEGSGSPLESKVKKQRKMSKDDPPIVKKEGMCVYGDCDKMAIFTEERGKQYCSNECVVKHCKHVFSNWLVQRRKS